MMFSVYYISYLPSASRKNREVLLEYPKKIIQKYLNATKILNIRSSTLVRELKKQGDFAEITAPECVETKDDIGCHSGSNRRPCF